MRAATILSTIAWVALVAASVAGRGAEPEPVKKTDDKQKAWQPGQITISKETTRITGPLRKDGYVDYVEALNRRASKGGTPKNNAAVMLLRAMGPGVVEKDVRTRYFKRLGIEPLPEKGDYFLEPGEYLKKARPRTWKDDGDRFWDEYFAACDRPWSEKQYPLLAGWLTANEKSLQHVAKAVRRPRYYSPLFVSTDQPWLAESGSFSFSVYSQYRRIVRSLGPRAMLRVKKDQIDRAREDALTLHLLARRLGQSSSSIDYVIGRSTEASAFGIDVQIAHHGDLTAKQVKRYIDDLVSLPPLSSAAHQVDINSRYEFLDAVGVIARKGPKALIEWTSDDEDDLVVAKELIRLSAMTGVDWDIVLRRGNTWHDQLAAAAGKPTCVARIKEVKKVLDRFNHLRTKRRDVKALAEKILGAKSRRQCLSETMGDYIAGIWMFEFESFYTNLGGRTAERTALLALALAAHRADNGAYPKTLSKLAPKYIAKLPLDPFSGADFRYRLNGKGYTLYSVGNNGKDDGGIDPDSDLVIDGLVESDDRVISTAK
ncbi:MAG: hypothetical protein IIA67_11375 [Planctomycetes bacterium]|nr:hypothetical protein [Planctomycetota bacterium]